MIGVLQAIALVLVACGGTAVVLTREPKLQVLVFAFFGLLLGVFFAVIEAPDVALSEIAVGSVALPAAILATLAKTERDS